MIRPRYTFYDLNNVYKLNQAASNETIKLIEKQTCLKNLDACKSNLNVLRRQLITGDGLGNKKDIDQIHLENLEKYVFPSSWYCLRPHTTLNAQGLS